MFKNMPKQLLALLIFICSTETNAAKRSTFSSKRTKRSTYSAKAPYSGFGQKSKVTGKIKTKSVSGHFKPSNNYKFINAYSRS